MEGEGNVAQNMWKTLLFGLAIVVFAFGALFFFTKVSWGDGLMNTVLKPFLFIVGLSLIFWFFMRKKKDETVNPNP